MVGYLFIELGIYQCNYEEAIQKLLKKEVWIILKTRKMKNILFITLVLTFASCQKEILSPTNEELKIESRSELTEEEALDIMDAEITQEFLSLRHQFAVKVNELIEGGYSPEAFAELAFSSETNEDDAITLNTLIFGNLESADIFYESLEGARSIMLTTFPVILDQEVEANFGESVSTLLSYRQAIATNGPTIGPPSGGGQVCGSFANQVRLLACATACGLGPGGVVAALCGWKCWCKYCNENSAVAEIIC